MQKSAKSFCNIDHQLFKEFYKDNVCGILLHKEFGTIIYGFGEDTLYVWLFRDVNGYSVLYDWFYFRFSTVWLNQLYNKLLANYLRNSGNELVTVRISVICGAMLSNNSL